MTIKEAIERLQCMRLFMEINDKQNESKFLEDDYIANDMAIKALEEIEEYKLKEFQCHLAQQEGITIGYNKAIDDFVATLVPRLTDAIYQKDVESMTNLINGVAEELKAGGIE